MKRIFIICTVRGASEEYKKKLEDYVAKLEKEGNKVHLPHRDTKQDALGYDICIQNMTAIHNADEVHLFYNPDSQGTHFDLGVAFSSNKKLVIVENHVTFDPNIPGKSFARMITEWETKGRRFGLRELFEYEANKREQERKQGEIK
jgi:hypothetical protein